MYAPEAAGLAHEVDAAPLSSCAEDPGRGGLQALVVVGDHQLHAAQAAPGPHPASLSGLRSWIALAVPSMVGISGQMICYQIAKSSCKSEG